MMSKFYNSIYIDSLISSYYNTTQLDTMLNLKLNASVINSYYRKTEMNITLNLMQESFYIKYVAVVRFKIKFICYRFLLY